MFTVIAAKKEFIDSVYEHSLFLKPFMENSSVSFCEWIPSEESPAESVPALEQIVKRHEKWRLIVIADGLDPTKKNPFNAVEYTPPDLEPASSFDVSYEEMDPDAVNEGRFYDEHRRFINEAYAEYLASFRPARHAAYEAAVKQPLVRLMTFVNEKPYVPDENEVIGDDPLYGEYLADMHKKQELRHGIVGDRVLRVTYPTEIICVAARNDYDVSYDIKTSWEAPDESQYSRFYDWNLYFDRMRYLIFDIRTKTHQHYVTDYLRFLFATLILANNETPQSVMQPNRVYTLLCENDDDTLRQLFARYNGKLNATKDGLTRKLDELLHQKPETLTDEDVRTEFCCSVAVPVTLADRVRTKEMLADRKKIGLATDCPTDEATAWRSRFRASRRVIAELLKLPRRALKKATDDFRFLNTLESERIQYLNEFQIDDVKEFVAKEELQMIGTRTQNIDDPERFFKQMNESDKTIREKIDTRMTRKTTVLLALTAIAAYLLGFIPFIMASNWQKKPLAGTLILAGAGVLLFAAVAFVSLFFLRAPLRKLVQGFNGVMHGIIASIVSASDDFGRYLSHACNVMRGYCVLNYRENNEPDQQRNVRILRKHLSDIDNARETMLEAFGPVADDCACSEEEPPTPYVYDFTRTCDYEYPIPFVPGDRRKIEFLQPGNNVDVPVALISRITLMREELYDNE